MALHDDAHAPCARLDQQGVDAEKSGVAWYEQHITWLAWGKAEAALPIDLVLTHHDQPVIGLVLDTRQTLCIDTGWSTGNVLRCAQRQTSLESLRNTFKEFHPVMRDSGLYYLDLHLY